MVFENAKTALFMNFGMLSQIFSITVVYEHTVSFAVK